MSRIPRPARPQAIAVFVGVVILLVGGVILGQADHPDPPLLAACGRRVPVKVISSTEKDDLLDQMSAAYNTAARPPGTICAQIAVEGVTSGAAEELLAHIDDSAITADQARRMVGAQVWAPSSRLWLERLARDAPDRAPDPKTVRSLAESQLVLAMPQPLAHKLHWDRTTPTWPQAMAALKDGTVNYEQDSPRASTSGALASYLTFGAAAAGSGDVKLAGLTAGSITDPDVTAFVRGVQGAARGGFVNDSTDILADWAKSASVPGNTMLLIQDQMVWGYDNGQYNVNAGDLPAVPLVVVQPRMVSADTPESLIADHPYAVLPGASAAQQAAAADFFAYVKAHWDPFCKEGFHDSEGRPPAGRCRSAGIPASVGRIDLATDFHVLALPAPAVQKQLIDQWMNMRPPRQILIAMDVSGSMQKKRLAGAVRAVKNGITLLRPQDEVQVVQFAGTKSFGRPHWTVLPLQKVGSSSTRDALLTRLDSRPSTAKRQQTAVLDTVDDVYRQMSARSHPGAADAPLEAVIVLSDGIDEWKGSRTAGSVCAGWQSIPHVVVDTVHYEPNAGEKYSRAQIEQGRLNLVDLAGCTSPQGLALQSDSHAPLNTVFRQVMGAL